MYWIDYYRKIIPNLCNLSNGGFGGIGSINLTKEEKLQKSKTMSNTFSKYNINTKYLIWSFIKKGYSLIQIQELYPDYSRQMDFGIRNGRQWNLITGIIKTKGLYKKGYYFHQRSKKYFISRIINNKKVNLFSSKNEEEVKLYLFKV